MAETRRYGLGGQFDIEQILREAQHRWLYPAEICEILRNYKKFRIAPEPANKPPSGSLFLFDRKVLRYFRNDGHNWKKKKNGKTIMEGHERLKSGSIFVLHCYYARGEENEDFQRRSYWMLEEDLSHIVVVHYREIKGNTNFNRIGEAEEGIPYSQETEDMAFNSEVDSFLSSKFHPYGYQITSQIRDTTILNSGQASEFKDAESDDYQGTQGDKDKNSIPAGSAYDPWKHLDFPLWDDVLENYTAEVQSVPFQPSLSSAQSDSMSFTTGQGNERVGQVFADGCARKQDFGSHPCDQEEGQTSEGDSSHMSKWPMNRKLHPDLAYNLPARFPEEDVNHVGLLNSLEPCHPYPADQNKHPMQNDLKIQPMDVEGGCSLKAELGNNLPVEGKADYSALRQPLLDGSLKEGLKKLDNFDRWMSKELEDLNDSHMQYSSGTYWATVGSEDGVDVSNIAPQVHLDSYMLGPSLSQDQLYSIIDFSPNWAYAGSEIKILITGRFLKSQQVVEKFKWSCMFGELEVPAEVIADDVLRCHTPLHQAGRVPFYVTCSNRLACSEVREFEYRENNIQDVDVNNIDSCSTSEILLCMRFGKLLSVGSLCAPTSVSSNVGENSHLSSKISSSMENDNYVWDQMLKLTSEDEWSPVKIKEQVLQKLLKEKLHVWLLQKNAEGGKGPCILDEQGQGVLHFAAALGYDWAIPPTIAAGVSVNFRDVNGWTALHWAASWGRERTVVLLISSGAAPGLVTDPTPEYPSGRTPADLAFSNGHKGIAGFLAESALSFHLSSLELKDTEERNAGDILGAKAVQTASERTATPISDGDLSYGLSLKDSLAAVCNATQAAARIHQVFRVQSFQKKQLKEYGDNKFGMSDEHALSFVAVKTNRQAQHDGPVHAAAIRIQNKFRGWKGRKEFLTIRQQIVKIQAHVRGHQVRKNYKKIIWSVGIVEKVILRWRRKGSGLRGFKPEALIEGGMQHTSSKEDDYDFLKEGRKQTEERLQKALARVKSMVQYPEARDQYRRLLNVVTEMQETKNVYSGALTSSEETADFDDDLIDLEALLDDGTFMSSALD